MATKKHWAFQIAEEMIKENPGKEVFVCASGITPSGTVHMGNFREMITTELVVRALQKLGKKTDFLYSWDDFDVLRKVPKNMPNQEMLKTYLRKPISKVPDPYDCNHPSFAEHNEAIVEETLPLVGIFPRFIRQTKMYESCVYADDMDYCLQNTDVIRKILNKYRTTPLPKDWVPISIFCSKCDKDTITKIEYRGDYKVYYECECGHKEEFDLREKGIAKLKWRVDWPMRWNYEKVDMEPGGKDHFAAGGSRDSGVELFKTLWPGKPPYGFMYEWIKIKGGGEFASSTGNVVTLNDVLDIYEPEIVRWLFAGTRPNANFQISFDTDVLKIYEDFEKCERIYFGEENVAEHEKDKQKLAYELSIVDKDKLPDELPIQPSFRHITNVLLSHDYDENKTYEFFRKDVKNEFDEKRLRRRITLAKNWLQRHAPDDFKFVVREQVPQELKESLSDKQKKAVKGVLDLVDSDISTEKLEYEIFEVAKKLDMGFKEFFTTFYRILIDKKRGPKLASFIEEIGRDKVKKLLNQVLD